MLRLLELFGSFSWDIAQQGKRRITKKVQVQGTGTGPRKSVTSEQASPQEEEALRNASGYVHYSKSPSSFFRFFFVVLVP